MCTYYKHNKLKNPIRASNTKFLGDEEGSNVSHVVVAVNGVGDSAFVIELQVPKGLED